LRENIKQSIADTLNESINPDGTLNVRDVVNTLRTMERNAESEGITLELSYVDRKIILHYIERKTSNKGAAAVFMQKLCDYADIIRRPIVLDVEVQNKQTGEVDGNVQAALIRYYARFGFKLAPSMKMDHSIGAYINSGFGFGMIRQPKA
ncbi:MAG: hypothetical protein JHC38_02825, partial [Thiotrichales bacterium]|nr:hypothetical protein [Thiotrichales bacterium]